jgi:hypothetical protein
MTRHSILLLTGPLLLWATHFACAQSAVTPPVGDTDERLSAIERRLEALEARSSEGAVSRVVYLDCETGDFTHIIPSGGYLVFMVSCDGVEPGAEGHRVRIRIGNPHSATFAGLQAQLGYGRDALAAESHVVGFSSSEPVRPGWNILTFTISPGEPEDLQTMRFSFSVSSAVMRVN